MSVVIVGGNECMNRKYIEICENYSCKARVYCKMSSSMKGIGNPDLMVLFTNTMSHKMLSFAMNVAKSKNTIVARSHTSSASALKSILDNHINAANARG